MFPLLEPTPLRLLFFGGKGGVGKTTCAAATALSSARRSPRRSFLLVSTDPAHSLADSLGDLQPPRNLKILEFNAQDSLETFKTTHRDKFARIAARGTFLDEDDIRRVLDLSLPGLDEFMALLEIAGWAETRAYDLIIVDTAPTGHTLRLLSTPELIRTWLKALDTLLAKHRYMQERFRGSYQRDELDDFLLGLAASVRQMKALLQDPLACRFVPVMLAEDLVISETLKLLGELEHLHISVTEVVVNRLFPENSCPLCTDGRRRQLQLLEQWLSRGAFAGYALGGVPLYAEEMRGQLLSTLWDGFYALGPGPLSLPAPALGTAAPGGGRAPLSPSRTQLLNLCRQRRGGQNHPGLCHRGAPGPGISRQRDFALFHRPGPLSERLSRCARGPPPGAPGPGSYRPWRSTRRENLPP